MLMFRSVKIQFLFALSVIILQTHVIGQSFNNHWINYDQQYLRISVSEDGLYRIPYSQLLSSGVPVNSIDPRNLQIFHNGEEQYIYIQGEGSTGIFDPSGFIEFYGKRNRGEPESYFFDNPSNQVNPDYSFYNDTSSYFITWNNSINNRRMQKIDDNNFSPHIVNAQDYCFRKIRVNYTSGYYWGSSRAIYTSGSGWFDNSVIDETTPRTKTIQTPEIYNSSVPINIELAVVGVPASHVTSSVPHQLKVEINGNLLIDEIYYGYEFIKRQLNISSQTVGSSISFVFSSNDVQQPSVTDRNAVSYISVKYPHVWDFNNSSYYEFFLPANSQDTKDYIEITDFVAEGSAVLYDLTNNKRISTQISGGSIRALVPDTDGERKMVLVGNSSYKTVNGIHKVSSNNRFVDYESINSNTDYIIVSHSSMMEVSNQYASYRNSTGYNVLVVDIDQLYYQYAFGIIKHPISIRNFAEHFFSINNKPKYLFLIGKSIHSRAFRNNSTHFANCLVPSAGNPSSDNLLTAGLSGTSYEPLYATGRLSARAPYRVTDYLNKVIEYEANPKAEWMKNVMHFGGGANASEQQTFENYLNNYKYIIEDTLFGGSVSSFFKTSSEPIQITQSDSVRNLIEGGVSLMTFFGHASSSGFDQSIDNLENYNNIGKYPFVLANSCFSGDIHLSSSNSISEKWVHIPSRGTIGFLASVGEGIPPYLNIYSEEFYRNVANKHYNSSIGIQIINTIKAIQLQYPDNIRLELTCHEFTLHGDPALVINSHELPDLLLENSGVSLTPDDITTSIDSFDVEILIKNIGRAVSDTFLISADRIFPDGTQENYLLPVNGCNYTKTVFLRIPVNRINGPGMNSLRFFVDSSGEIEESDELNNEITINFMIKSGDLIPVYPYKYAIYPENSVTLIASSVDPFIGTTNYVFRIDTTVYFNSLGGNPMAQGIVQGHGGLISWQVPFELSENTVYYWQVSQNHSNPDSLVWKESSFIYMPEELGWSQAHFFQFEDNDYRFINYNKQERKFDFVTTPKQLHVHNRGSLWSSVWYLVRWTIDGAVMNGDGDYASSGTASAMMVVVIDPQTLKAWPSNKENFGHRNYPNNPARNRADYYYVFNSTSSSSMNTQLDSMRSLLNNKVPDGHFILVYSWKNGYFQQWSEELYQTFENFGSSHIRNVPNSYPYIFFTKKGTPNSNDDWEKIGNSPSDNIDLYVNLETDFNYGNIRSVLVGPSNTWKSLHWGYESVDNPLNEDIRLNLYGVRASGTEDILLQDILHGEFDIYNLDDSVDYLLYPHVKLDFYSRNDSVKIPAQLNKWQLKFDPVAETAIDPSSGYFFCCDTVNEGEEIRFAVATRNISDFEMDSLHVKYWLLDNNNNQTIIDVRKLRAHPSGDVIIDTITYTSLGLSGINSIWVQYNPLNPESENYYQTEQYYFNNIAAKYFYVQKDITNPLLDISFDGKHIMDGDIVSARPEILIQLKDENKFLELNDTAIFRIFIMDTETGTEERVYFAERQHPDENLIWIPAELPNNSCKIIYKPIFEQDGVYQLRVQARDISLNESGKNDFVIRFQVINNSSITHLLNYPNPFSTSTRFVFELTGHQIPDDLRIEIFTVTGRLVKVIFREELGPIYIGKNITEYAWDGNDMFGDKLANGVYFFKVKATIEGQDIEHRSTEADKFFKKQIGKMYLIR
jgi:hypothetical protein